MLMNKTVFVGFPLVTERTYGDSNCFISLFMSIVYTVARWTCS